MLLLRHRVGHDDLVQSTVVDTINGISTQNAVGDECNHLCSTLLLQELRRASDGVRCIGQIVNEDSRALGHVSDQHHCSVLAVADLCGAALLVDESKGHAECVGDGGRSLRTTCIRRDYDGLLVVWNIELDVFAEEVTPVQVVNGNIEESLVLGV